MTRIRMFLIIISFKTVYRFQESCMYNAKKYAKSWIVGQGYNPHITNWNVVEE